MRTLSVTSLQPENRAQTERRTRMVRNEHWNKEIVVNIDRFEH